MDISVLTLSRFQFALTIMFHYLFPPPSIGLGGLLVFMEGMYLKTGNRQYEAMTKFWTKIFAVNFAVGVAVLNVLAIANIPRAIHLRRPGYAFASSCATIGALTFLFGVALFPDLVHSSLNLDWSLTVYNAASSRKTLGIMATIAALGMPFVVAYTSVVYWVFRGKVQLGKFSY